MNDQQFQQFLAAARPGRRAPTLDSIDPVAFLNWRDNFEKTVTINGWNAQRAKREAAASVLGEAKDIVRDLDTEDDAQNLAAFLTAYQDRFVSPAQTRLAQSEFKGSAQQAGESLLQWHSRCRRLFLRAYPAQAGQVNESPILLQHFVEKLRNPTVMQYVNRRNPATYQAAFEDASSVEAADALTANALQQQTGSTPVVKSEPKVNAVAPGIICYRCRKPGHRQDECRQPPAAKARTIRCYGCQGFGHMRSECPSPVAPSTGAGTGPPRAMGRGSGFRARGRGTRGHRGRFASRRGAHRPIGQLGGDDVGETVEEQDEAAYADWESENF